LFFLVEAGSCEESSFEVSNVGSERAFDIEVSDPFSPFSMTTDCPGELFPEQSCSVMVSFCPLEEDIYGGRIDIDYSDTKSDSTVTVMLNAEGIQP
jgi:hypothetical protein